MGFRTGVIAALGLLALTGCAAEPADTPGAPAQPRIERLSDNLFMVPVARDDRGCVMYRMRTRRSWSERTFYWRVGPGHYSNNPQAARCA